jgi:uncharacterized protein (PEP-CTERM system associated)
MLKLAPLAIAAMLLSSECRADWKFTPQVNLRESYSDNVNNQTDNLARSSWVSEADPGFSLTDNSPRLRVSASGEWRLYAYSQKALSNVHDSDRFYRANAQAKLIEELLYLDGDASESRQAISAFGPLTNNPFSSANNTRISTWRISPYLRHRFGSSADLTVRYARDSVDAGVNGIGTSLASTRTADLVSGPQYTALTWNLSYNHQDLNSRFGGRSSSENDLGGVRWNLGRTFGLTASVGYDKYAYPSLNEREDGRSWSGGFVWTPSTRTSVQASVGHRYFGKTGSLDSSYRTQHSIWALTYNDGVTTTRSQFLLPAAVDTAAMLDHLFANAFPDPVQRQQAVQAYIAATGLPPTLADSINFLSNRYFRERRLQGAVTFKGARSDLVLTVFRDQRNALSRPQDDSALGGNALATVNDNVRQRGANAHFDYRLSTRTEATAGLYVTRAQSLTTGLASTSRALQLGMTRRFDAKTYGSLELRHTAGRPDPGAPGSYHENAIAATLSVLY